MITLKTLAQATEQEVFNQVARHLLTQMKQSRSNTAHGGCAYRGDDGLKCAAGCLIADDEYSPDMENQQWSDTLADRIKIHSHEVIIDQLQAIHDCNFPSDWKELLIKLAKKSDLKLEDDIFNT